MPQTPLSFSLLIILFFVLFFFVFITSRKQAESQALRSEQSMLVRQLQSNFCLRDWQVDKWRNLFIL